MHIIKKIKILPFIFTLCICGWGYTQNSTKKDVYTAIKADLVIDGTDKAPIKNGVILIKNDLILQVGNAADVKLPSSTNVIDYQDKTIIPTLISAHSHLGIANGISDSDINNKQDNVQRQLKLYAQYGIGAFTSLGRDMGFIYQLRADRNSGKLGRQYAYIITAGKGLGVPSDAPPKMQGYDPVYRQSTQNEIEQALDTLAVKKPNIVKIWVDDLYGSLPKMRPGVYETIIDESHKRGMRVAAHIFCLSEAEQLVNNDMDVLERSVRDKPTSGELIKI